MLIELVCPGPLDGRLIDVAAGTLVFRAAVRGGPLEGSRYARFARRPGEALEPFRFDFVGWE